MLKENYLRQIVYLSGLSVLILFLIFIFTMIYHSLPAMKASGFSFFVSHDWNPIKESFGVLPFLFGTLLTAVLALIISFPFSLSVAIILGEYCKKGFIFYFLRMLIELLAGIPSVIYGFWGLLVLVPWMRSLELKLGIMPYGVGILTASIILAIMIVPFSASIAREMIALVPNDYKEAAIALGATKFELLRRVILPYTKSGIFAGYMLALGRALGETMAVTMVIGNSTLLPKSIFSPGNTIASLLANEFAEASSDLYLSYLVEIGFVLLVITIVINLLGQYITKKMSIGKI